MEGLTYKVATPAHTGRKKQFVLVMVSHKQAIIIFRADGSAAQEVITILIENYIPFGYENRISREKLSADTHMSDRKIRKLMEEALLYRETLIINIDNGYFRPDGSLGDRQKAKAYLYREQMRTSSCSKRCKAIRQCLTPKADDTGQMSLKEFGIG